MGPKKTKQNKIKVILKYAEPASEAERKEQERGLDAAFDILFKAMLEDGSLQKNKGGKGNKKSFRRITVVRRYGNY